MFITVSNLFPCPDHPTRGMYNYYLFRQLRGRLGEGGNDFQNLCLVPSWKVWQWATIRRWTAPAQVAGATVPTRYIPVPYLPWVGRSLNDRLYSWALRRFLNLHFPVSNHQSPIFYVPWIYPDGVAVGSVVRERHARLWLMALGTDTFHLRSAVRRRKILAACEKAEGIVCVANVVADRLVDAGVPREKLHVVPNGVDKSLFRMRSREELLSCQVAMLLSKGAGDPSSLPVTTEQLNNLSTLPPPLSTTQQPNNPTTIPQQILFIGNLVPVKGPDVLLRAFAALGGEQLSSCRVAQLLSESPMVSPSSTTQQPNNLTTVLLIIGTGPMKAQLERMAKDLGIADRVHFLGRLPPEKVALWMNRADVLCLSSRSEGMPNVVLEARASGLPVVATPAGAIPELPLDKDHFLVVKSCRPVDLAEGLREMLGRNRANRKSDPAIPTWAQQADKVLALIRDS